MFEITHETPNSSKILTEDALNFLGKFISAFEERRKQLLDERENTQKSIDSGNFMSFPDDTSVRDKDWQVVPSPSDVAQRHVEITGPVDRKMIINALNSGADVFMADFEDSTSPTWENIINGHNNLIDAKVINWNLYPKELNFSWNVAISSSDNDCFQLNEGEQL